MQFDDRARDAQSKQLQREVSEPIGDRLGLHAEYCRPKQSRDAPIGIATRKHAELAERIAPDLIAACATYRGLRLWLQFAKFAWSARSLSTPAVSAIVNYPDPETGQTALHAICSQTGSHVSRYLSRLLAYGADPRLQDQQGNTPMHLALKNRLPSADISQLTNLLLKHGGSAVQPNKLGQSALDLSLARGKVDLFERLVTATGSRPIGAEQQRVIAQQLIKTIKGLANEDHDAASLFFDLLISHRTLIGEDALKMTVVAALSATGRHPPTLFTGQLVNAGIELTYQGDDLERLLVDRAARDVNGAVMQKLVLQSAWRVEPPKWWHELIHSALDGQLPRDAALLVVGSEIERRSTFDPSVADRLRSVDAGRLVGEKSLARFYQYGAQFEQMLDIARIEQAPRNKTLTIADEILPRILPNLLHSYPNGVIDSAIEKISKGPPDNRRRGLIEGDLMALLNHPARNWAGSDAGVAAIVRALRRGGGFSRTQTPSWQVIDCWAQVGTLAHSFTKWRFDSIRTIQPGESNARSLLERYGFESRAGRATDDTGADNGGGFGVGFVLPAGKRQIRYQVFDVKGAVNFAQVDPNTRVEFRRGYLLIDSHEHGSLVIRNSSTVFGRAGLGHAAYWRAAKNKPLDLDALNADRINRQFQAVSSAEFARDKDAVHHALGCLRELHAVIEDYSAWKFDTREASAWMGLSEGSSKQLVGGHLSNGFAQLVGVLDSLHQKQQQIVSGVVPALAFVPSRATPWGRSEFKVERQGSQRELPVDDSTLPILKRLANHEPVTDQELQRSGIRSFFQQAGFDTQGELIMVAPAT